MKNYLAAAIQMNSQPDFDHNLDQAYELIRKAAGEGARFVGLPEHFTYLGDQHVCLVEAKIISDQTPAFLKNTAREFDIYLHGGSYPMPSGNDKVYNRSLLISPEGKILAKYDKIHLFDVELPKGESYRESSFVEGGKNSPVSCPTEELGTVGMSICYDLRFPELYRKLIDEDAELICVPAAFTATTGKDHWKPLLQARAIENTSYFFASAQTGTHGEKRKTHGHSMILDPWGEVLADAGIEVGVALAEVSQKRLREVRQRIPSLEHRRIK